METKATTTKKDHDDTQKKLQIDQLVRCCDEPEIHISIECSICGERFNEFFQEDEVPGVFLGKAAESAYSEGWRYTTSEVFELIGPICGDCIEDKDNHDAHE